MEKFKYQFENLQKKELELLEKLDIIEEDLYYICKSLYMVAYNSECCGIGNHEVELVYKFEDIDNFKKDFQIWVEELEVELSKENIEKLLNIIIKLYSYSSTYEEEKSKAKAYFNRNRIGKVGVLLNSEQVNSIPSDILEKIKSEIILSLN